MCQPRSLGVKYQKDSIQKRHTCSLVMSYCRINAMFKIIFIFMLLFLALASLTTINHLFLNHFITEHRNSFSLTKNIKGQCSAEFYPHNRMVNKR